MNLHSEAMSAMDLLVDTSSRREWVSRRLRNHLWGGSWKCLTNSFLKEVRLLWHKAARLLRTQPVEDVLLDDLFESFGGHVGVVQYPALDAALRIGEYQVDEFGSFQFLRRGGLAEQVFLEVLIDVAEEMFYHVPCRVGHVRQVGVACGTGVGGVYFEADS